MWPSVTPAMASRAVSLASRWVTVAPPSALGNMMASGLPATTASRSASVMPGVEAVDAHQKARALLLALRALEEIQRRLARDVLALGRDRILEIDDHGVGAARQRLVELGPAVGGNEEQRAHHCSGH